ncbi:MAG: pseudouridine synthase [Archangium sp.]|nr:pseudouridine synthase [Archangium sp.]
MERLQKYLSRAGVASRRHAEAMIVDGRVKLNGKVVTVLGTQVDPGKDLVLLDGNLVAVNPERKYFLFYKPPGVVTTLSDPEGRPSVGDYAKDTGGRVFPIGRLDYDAEGALLLTDDGDLANKLMHPSHQVPRVYLAKVKGVPDEPSLQKLVDGVRLEDGMAHAVQAQIFEKAERNTWVKIIVTEGRQHLVKRLFAAIGHPVVRLYRPAHAGLPVHGLRPGELRELTNDEIRRVKAAADGDAQPEPRLTLPARRHGHAAPGFEPEEDTRPEGRGAKDDEARPEESVAPEQEESDAPPPEPRSSRADDSRSSRAESREPAPAARKPFAGRESARAGSEGRPPARVNRFGEASGGKSAAGAGAERGKFGDRGGKFGARDASGAGAKFGERGGKFGARDAGGPGAGRGKFGGPGDDRGGKRFGARDAGGPGAERGSKRFGARDVGGGDDRGGKRFGARDAGGGDDRGGKRFGARDAGGGDDRGGKRFGARDAGGPGGKRFGARDAAGPGGKRFGGDRGGKRFGGPSSQEGFNGAGGKRRFGGDERPRPFPGEKGYEGKRKFGGPPANVSRPFPGERGVPGFGRKKMEEAARQEESPRSRFGGAGGPRSDGARGFGDPATRRGERASGPRRTGPGAKPGGFKAGGFKKGGFQKGGFKGGGRKGPGAGRSSPRKPRGSW